VDGEEVSTHTVEGVQGLLGEGGRLGRVAGGNLVTYPAGSSVSGEVSLVPRPVHGRLGTLEHGGDPSMTRVEVLHDLLPQAVRDDWSVIEEYHWTRDHQSMAVLVIGFDVIIPVNNVFRDTSGDSVVEELIHGG
jgi:hypothetical protein